MQPHTHFPTVILWIYPTGYLIGHFALIVPWCKGQNKDNEHIQTVLLSCSPVQPHPLLLRSSPLYLEWLLAWEASLLQRLPVGTWSPPCPYPAETGPRWPGLWGANHLISDIWSSHGGQHAYPSLIIHWWAFEESGKVAKTSSSRCLCVFIFNTKFKNTSFSPVCTNETCKNPNVLIQSLRMNPFISTI